MLILRTAVRALALGCLLQAADTRASRPIPPDAPNAGASGAAADSRNSSQRRRGRVTVTGRLTGEGVECQALRTTRGRLYTLTGNLRGFKAGDRVRVVGRVAEMSFCMQGTPLVVESITRSVR